jgi:hypothetical protein
MTTKMDGSSSTGGVRLRRTSASAIVGWALIAAGCDGTHVTNNYYTQAPKPDAGEPDAAADAGVLPGETSEPETSAPNPTSEPTLDAGGTADAGGGESTVGETSAPSVDAGGDATDLGDAGDGGSGITPENLELDMFGTYQNTFKFVVSDEQLSIMNQRYNGGGGPIYLYGNQYGDIYQPGGNAGGDTTFVDHLFATNTVGETADFGKTEVKLVGESTGRAWTTSSLPNFRVDTNEFTKGQKLGGYENVRFNNAIVGSIFREKFTFDFYRDLGYPAPQATYAWVQTSVWGDEVKVPYVAVEVYKRDFCKNREEYFGGECPNMWEFPGDFGQGRFTDPEACQFSECDATRVSELDAIVADTRPGPGYKEALAEYLDWDSFHEFQCLSWIFVTGDDALHNMNNFVLVERPDGKFQYLPYSIDISFGQDWYRYVELPGQNTVARGCQADPDCWADTVATCDVLLDAFEAAEPLTRLDNLYSELDTAGMLRNGDEDRYQDMRRYIEERLTNMPGELDALREGPYANGCPEGQIMCGNYCAYQWDCYLCNGGEEPGPGPKPIPAIVPAPGNEQDAIIVPPPGGGGETSAPEGDAGVTTKPEGDGGVEPNPCLPYYNLYDVK